MLEEAGLPAVPVLAERVFGSLAELAALAHAPSRFYDGPVEGVYLRAGAVRGKIVRAGFVQAIGSHWTHAPLTRNTLRR